MYTIYFTLSISLPHPPSLCHHSPVAIGSIDRRYTMPSVWDRLQEDMQLAGLATRTQEAYLGAARRLADHVPRWVREHRVELFAVLPPTVSRLPSESTIRRTLARLDVAALETALAAF